MAWESPKPENDRWKWPRPPHCIRGSPHLTHPQEPACQMLAKQLRFKLEITRQSLRPVSQKEAIESH